VSESKSLYSDVIMEHIKNARNFRALADASHRAQGLNPLCGDTFDVYVRVEDGRIAEASFQCECCGISMASASVMTEVVKGRAVAEVQAMSRDFARLLRKDGPEVSLQDGGQLAVLSLIREVPSRVNCALLGWQTLEAALDGRNSVSIEG
jgi:nitrogen fixation NifU-like protein